MSQIPADGLLRLNQILGQPNATPPVPAIIPINRSTWFNGVQSGKFPKPVHIAGGRAAFYRVADIRKLLEST